jgi:hypothetical protein
MAVREVVRFLRLYFQDEGASLRQRYGPEAVAAAEGIVRLLEPRLQDESAYGSLWDAFEEDPEAADAQLTGALEAFVEGDPGMAKEVNAFVEEIHEVMARSREQKPPVDRQGFTQSDVIPDTTLTAGDKYEWEGTYLYANVKDGTEPLTEDTGASAADFERRREALMDTLNSMGLPALFTRMREAAENHPGLTLNERVTLKERLETLQDEVAKGEEADGDAIVAYARRVEELSPDIAQFLLDGLTNFADRLSPQAQEALLRIRNEVRSRGVENP